MPDIIQEDTMFVGGWFGDDGQSTPDEQPFVDGWFGGPMTQSDFEDSLQYLFTKLIENKPIYINPIGDLEELKLVWPI